MSEEQISALCKIARELPGQFREAWRQSLAKDGHGIPSDEEIRTDPEKALLEIISNQISLRLGRRVTENLFAEFGPKSKQSEARMIKHFLAALYGANGKPPIKQFAREAAERNRKTLRRVSRERAEARAQGRQFWEKGSPQQLYGGGATRAESMLQYVRRMLKDE